MRIIKNTIPDGRIVSDIIGSVPDSPVSGANSPSGESFFNETSSTTSQDEYEETTGVSESAPSGNSPSLDDLYADL